MSGPTDTLFRVERGRPSPEELAVVAAVLRSVLAPRRPTGAALAQATWPLRSLGPAGSWAVRHRTAPDEARYAAPDPARYAAQRSA